MQSTRGRGCACSVLELWALSRLLAEQGRQAQAPAGQNQREERQSVDSGGRECEDTPIAVSLFTYPFSYALTFSNLRVMIVSLSSALAAG